jgi:hypothetical protein
MNRQGTGITGPDNGAVPSHIANAPMIHRD